jgi:acyl-CoA synthetase (AMP-forming)/AMP-acid ligase II
MGWSYANVWQQLAGVVGDRIAVASTTRSLTFRELDDRAERVAAVLEAAEVQPGAAVAIDLINGPEYLEVFYGALKAGCVPVNVNYRYVGTELAYLIADSGAQACVYDTRFATAVDDAGIRKHVRCLLEVVGPDGPSDTGAVEYARAVDAAPVRRDGHHVPSGDDLITIYTGGTTGMPKGVEWRNDDLYVALWQVGKPGSEPPDPVAFCAAGGQAMTCLPASPLMHGTALFTALSTLSGGGTTVLVEAPSLDADAVLSAAADLRVGIIVIVGDAYAKPLLQALDASPGRWDLDSVRAVRSSGVVLSPASKERLLRHMPRAVIVDTLGSTESVITSSVSTVDNAGTAAAGTFAPRPGVRVVSETTGTDVVPGSGEIGLVAVTGRLPLGYRNDPEKSASTFRDIDGVRYTVAGDHATVGSDGTIQLVGRGSACINTGGEKVFAEEVEMVLRQHPGVQDCVVVGVPDDRWGERVVALIQRASETAGTADLDEFAKSRMAGYKRPKEYFYVDRVPRAASGKLNYPELRALAVDLAASAG